MSEEQMMSDMDVATPEASFEIKEYLPEYQKKTKKKKKHREVDESCFVEDCSSSAVFLEQQNYNLPVSAEPQEEEKEIHLKAKKHKKQKVTEMPNEETLLEEKKNKKERKKRQREQNVEDSGVHIQVEENERKVKKKKWLHEVQAQDDVESCTDASRQDLVKIVVQEDEEEQGELSTDSKVTASPQEVRGMADETNSVEMAVDFNMETAIKELKEFVPDADKKAFSVIGHMIKYDLPRFKKFKQQGLTLRRGRFTAEENERLIHNVSDFLALTGIESASKLFFPKNYPEEMRYIKKMKSLHGFHLHLAAGIPRPWHDVYCRGRKLFNNFELEGRYTENDLKSLLKLYKQHGPNWMKISELTGRSNLSLEKRFSHLAHSNGKWSEEEEKKLVGLIRNHMLTRVEPESGSDCQDPTIRREKLYSDLPWKDVAQQMETRSWSQCRVKWMGILKKKMTFGQNVFEGRKSLQAKIRLIKALYAMNIEDSADVDWEQLTSTIGNVPPAYVQAKFYKLKVTRVPGWQNKDFTEIIDFLYKYVIPELEKDLQSCKDDDEEVSMDIKEVFHFSDIFDTDYGQVETETQQLD
ncbi:transcription termination factor 1 [Arapaima gigas]